MLPISLNLLLTIQTFVTGRHRASQFGYSRSLIATLSNSLFVLSCLIGVQLSLFSLTSPSTPSQISEFILVYLSRSAICIWKKSSSTHKYPVSGCKTSGLCPPRIPPERSSWRTLADPPKSPPKPTESDRTRHKLANTQAK